MDAQVKQIFGEYAFTIAALQHQIENLNKQIEELKNENKLQRLSE